MGWDSKPNQQLKVMVSMGILILVTIDLMLTVKVLVSMGIKKKLFFILIAFGRLLCEFYFCWILDPIFIKKLLLVLILFLRFLRELNLILLKILKSLAELILFGRLLNFF